MAINKVMLTGNLTRDAELKSLPNGTSVLEFGVAVNERSRNQSGEWEDRPNFFDCTLYGNRAEGIAPFMAKGKKVALEGRLQWRQWERDGEKRSKVSVIVNEVEFMEGARKQEAPAPRQDVLADVDIPF